MSLSQGCPGPFSGSDTEGRPWQASESADTGRATFRLCSLSGRSCLRQRRKYLLPSDSGAPRGPGSRFRAYQSWPGICRRAGTCQRIRFPIRPGTGTRELPIPDSAGHGTRIAGGPSWCVGRKSGKRRRGSSSRVSAHWHVHTQHDPGLDAAFNALSESLPPAVEMQILLLKALPA